MFLKFFISVVAAVLLLHYCHISNFGAQKSNQIISFMSESNNSQSTMIPAIRVPAKKLPAEAAFIFLHGLGDTGSGWAFFADYVSHLEEFKKVNFVFPNAPRIPISVNHGAVMPGWFDIFELGDPNARQDTDGFLKSCETLKSLIKEQTDSGVSVDKIIIGGFSQGAAISLAAGALLDEKVGGIVALSGFCPIQSKIKELHNGVNDETPIFQAHGTQDPIISHDYGKNTSEFYKELGYKNLTFNTYSMGHSTCQKEFNDLTAFLTDILK